MNQEESSKYSFKVAPANEMKEPELNQYTPVRSPNNFEKIIEKSASPIRLGGYGNKAESQNFVKPNFRYEVK